MNCSFLPAQGTANKLCLEKTDWLNSNKENASVAQLYRAKKELEEGVQHIMLKLEDLGKKNRSVEGITEPFCQISSMFSEAFRVSGQ